jgi:hypothetical protein
MGTHVSIGINGVFVSKSAAKNYRPQNANLIQNSGTGSTGIMSDRTRCKLKSLLINWLSTEIPFQKSKKNEVKFVTLTFPPSVLSQFSAIDIRRKFLNPFLLSLGRAGCTHWFWVGEIGANGFLHYHLIVSSFPNGFREKWCRLVGSVSSNCCVIRPVRHFSKLIGYVTKGCTSKQTGRIWGASKTVRQFENVKLKEDEAERFLCINAPNLKYQLSFDFGDLFKPNARLTAKIKAHFMKLRKRQDVLGVSVGSASSLPLHPLIFHF